jgi:hypothetical protein
MKVLILLLKGQSSKNFDFLYQTPPPGIIRHAKKRFLNLEALTGQPEHDSKERTAGLESSETGQL